MAGGCRREGERGGSQRVFGNSGPIGFRDVMPSATLWPGRRQPKLHLISYKLAPPARLLSYPSFSTAWSRGFLVVFKLHLSSILTLVLVNDFPVTFFSLPAARPSPSVFLRVHTLTSRALAT